MNEPRIYTLNCSCDILDKIKIKCIDIYDNKIISGDTKGGLILYQLNIQNIQNKENNQNVPKKEMKIIQSANNPNLSKYEIDKVQILPVIKHILVLSNGLLRVVRGDDLNNLYEKPIIEKNCVSFQASLNDNIVAATNKKLLFFNFDPNEQTYRQEKVEINLNDTVLKIQWAKQLIWIVYKKSYFIYNTMAKKETNIANLGSTFPLVISFEKNWVITIGDNVCMYTPEKDENKPLFNINPNNKGNPVKDISIHIHYLIVLKEITFSIFNLKDNTLMQEGTTSKEGSNLFLGILDNNFFILSLSNVSDKKNQKYTLFNYQEIPPDEQVSKLLNSKNVPEAQRVFFQNNQMTDTDYQKKLEGFNMECAWSYMKILEFEKAADIFKMVNFDPRELAALIPDIFQIKPSSKNNKEKIDLITLENILEEDNSTQQIRKEVIDKKIEEAARTVFFLLNFKRKALEDKFDFKTDLMKVPAFNYSSAPINPQIKVEQTVHLEEIIEIIESSIVKIAVEYKMKDEIFQFFQKNWLNLKLNYKEMTIYLKEKEKEKNLSISLCASIALGLLHERFNSFKESLDIWKKLATSGVEDQIRFGVEQIIKILKKVNDKQLILVHIKTILILKEDLALKIFQEDHVQKLISEDEIIEYLDVLKQFAPQLKEKYLEYIVTEKKNAEERFFNQLAMHYINKIKDAKKNQEPKDSKKIIDVKEIKKNLDYKELGGSKSNLDGSYETDVKVYKKAEIDYRFKFSRLFEIAPKNFGENIIQHIEGLGLLDEEILIYSKLKRHNEAIDKLVEQGIENKNFLKAEEYCLKQEENLLEIVFGKLMSKYMSLKSMYQEKISKVEFKKQEDREKVEKDITFYQEYCSKFLMKYSTSDKLDCEKVINLIPDEWFLNEENPDQKDSDKFCLREFLKIVFNDKISKEYRSKITKNIAEMQKLTLESELAKLQKAYIIMVPERKCKACNNIVGTAKSIQIYPNGVVTHLICAKDITICPVTGIDFKNYVNIK